MDIKDILTAAIEQAAKDAMAEGVFPEGELPTIVLEVPPQKEFGDFATNFAMQSAKVFHKNPRQIAEELVRRIQGSWLDHTQIAGPGFLNFYLKGNVLYDAFQQILAAGESFGQLPPKDAPKIQVEYVSANPTGLLHVGHGRGAAAGSALVNLLRAAGYPVESEYYINDAGNQMDNLARSVMPVIWSCLAVRLRSRRMGIMGRISLIRLSVLSIKREINISIWMRQSA